MRIGSGFDVHALVPGRKLILGGVEIPYERGLAGHSDADVLIHAICDAILGALGLRDIGHHFPDTDPRYKGIDSRELLRACVAKMFDMRFQLGNLDATIIAQAPKMAPHLDQMIQHLQADFRHIGLINIKATTTEYLGFTGRGEGIAAHAVILLMSTNVPTSLAGNDSSER